MTDALNICPCCKGEARYMSVRWEVVASGSLHLGYTKASECVVRCVNCGLSTKPCRSLAEAGALWNRREQVRDVQALNEAQAATIRELTRQLTQVRKGYKRKELSFGAPKGDGTDAMFCGPTGDWGPAEVTAVLSEREAGE